MEYSGPRSPDAPGRSIPIATRKLVVSLDSLTCVYCGLNPSSDIDHIYPWAQGGTHHVRNLVTCCHVCNSIAGLRVFRDFTEKRSYILMRRNELGAEAINAAQNAMLLGHRIRIE